MYNKLNFCSNEYSKIRTLKKKTIYELNSFFGLSCTDRGNRVEICSICQKRRKTVLIKAGWRVLFEKRRWIRAEHMSTKKWCYSQDAALTKIMEILRGPLCYQNCAQNIQNTLLKFHFYQSKSLESFWLFRKFSFPKPFVDWKPLAISER